MNNKFQIYETNQIMWIHVVMDTIVLDSNYIRGWLNCSSVNYLTAQKDSDEILDHRYGTNTLELESVYSLKVTRWIEYERR